MKVEKLSKFLTDYDKCIIVTATKEGLSVCFADNRVEASDTYKDQELSEAIDEMIEEFQF